MPCLQVLLRFRQLLCRACSCAQVSMLHMSHHAEMAWVMWFLVTQCPGANSFFGPFLNSTVHTFMYAYYALTGKLHTALLATSLLADGSLPRFSASQPSASGPAGRC